jgi:hypothetical protein
MAVEVRRVTREELEEELREYEDKFGMESVLFLKAFQNGELDESEDFLDWANLIAAWRLTFQGR